MRRDSRPGRDTAAGAGDAHAAEMVDTLGQLFLQFREHFERAIQPLGLPGPQAKALRLIDGAIGMKELGARIQCDASFVTAIADGLEERGLVRRETDPADRRVKNLVLTDEGTALRTRLVETLYRDVPGLRGLDDGERDTFLRLLHKMVGCPAVTVPEAAHPAPPEHAQRVEGRARHVG